ncbi:hypothetical protein D3C86_1919390 [compost metagenome]
MCSLFDFAGDVSDEEIKEFSDRFLTPEMRSKGYGEEDQEQTSERITRWRNKHRAAIAKATE